MATLPVVLGHDVTATAVVESLRPGTIVVIQGPPGVGKSWLAKGIGGSWEERGGSAIVAEGHLLQSDVDFFPLNLALAPLSSNWRAVGADLIRTSEAGERMAGTGGLITSMIQALVQLRPARQRARKLFLGKEEQSILFDLERIAEDKPLLLIADNLHWWDEASLGLLGRMQDPRLGEAFRFLAELHVIAIQTVSPYQEVAHKAAHDALLTSGMTEEIDVSRPPKGTFAEVLSALGAPPARARVAAEDLYALTGGHLALAARCAKLLEIEEPQSLLAARGREHFRRRLLTDRVSALGGIGGSTALTVLQIAAVLGLRFRRADLVCAFEGEASVVSRALRDCRDEELIELSEDVGRFAHDLFRAHFLEAGDLDMPSVHESIAECLRLLRPAEYLLRCEHARRAEREREAGALGVHAALQRQRDGLPWKDLPEYALAAIENQGLRQTVEAFEAALNHLDGYRFTSCRETLDGLPRNLPRSLNAEADAIRATCLLATRSEDDREAAETLLRRWNGYETEEPELGTRLMHLRLYALTLIVDKTPGRELEGQIRQALADRADYDRSAEDAIYTLDRCSGSLFEPDHSLTRVREAAEHFGPSPGLSVIRRPVEYYRCLVNVGAKLVTNAAYTEALGEYAKLDRLIAEYTPNTFPRVDYPLTTALLAEYRIDAVSASEAVERQREIGAQHGVPGDPFYQGNAEAVFLALAGSSAEALEIFDRLEGELSERARPAPSMLYLIRANRCATGYVCGDGSAKAEWDALGDLVTQIPYLIRRYLIARHQLLGEVMARGEASSAIEFDECLVRTPRFGRFWDQLGRGFRMPEVEWWR
ncbi:MAG: hypothetical protein E6G51_05185 [Actinobacteria bacterium]|nr:MAG: hypothetical protein E6G51_05185 [Actinomycetota bacterium]